MHMHLDVSPRRAVQVVTAEDAFYDTALVSGSYVFIQLHSSTTHVSGTVWCRRTLTAAVCIVINTSTLQVHLGVLPDETALGTAIDVAGNDCILAAV